jgi:hypothetical protein
MLPLLADPDRRGSGSIVIAAEKTGRRTCIIEIDLGGLHLHPIPRRYAALEKGERHRPTEGALFGIAVQFPERLQT